MSNIIDIDVVGPMVIRFHPGKLLDLAAVSLAASLLRYKITRVRQNGGKAVDTNALDLAHVSSIPTLDKIIDDLVHDMNKNWISWWYHHHTKVFLQRSSADSMIDCMDQLIWLPDGTINYEQTARKMLFSDMMTQEQKFQLACAYCFMNDVERLQIALTREQMEHACLRYDESNDGFSNYWHVRMATVLAFSGLEGSVLDRIFFSPLVRVRDLYFSLGLYDEWSAIEYCFDQSSNENRLDKVRMIISRYSSRIILNILAKLTDFELNLLISEHSPEIIKALVKNRNYEYTILIWKRMVHVIGDAVLAEIINYVNDIRSEERSYINSLLCEMWMYTLERQKNYIIREKICDFTELYLDLDYNYYYTPNYRLILDFLYRCNLDRKYEYWSETWSYLVVGQLDSKNRDIIDHMMKLCIVDDQQIDNFKQITMINYDAIAEFCELLIYNGRVDEIQSYLEFCTSDSQAIRDVKKQIIMETPKADIFEFLFEWLDDKSNRDFNQYIDDVFTENESKEFFNEMIMHPDNLNRMCIALNSSGKLKKVMAFVEKFVSSQEDLVKVKQGLFEQIYETPIIEQSRFVEFMGWCLNADKSVVEMFKKFPTPVNSELNEGPVEELNEERPVSDHDIYDAFIRPYIMPRYDD